MSKDSCMHAEVCTLAGSHTNDNHYSLGMKGAGEPDGVTPFTRFCPPKHTVNWEHLKTGLELHEWLKMDIMNLMEKATTFHHLNGTFTAQNRFCSPVWRHFDSMADSMQQDRILMGIKSKAAPVTVTLSQSVCLPAIVHSALGVCVCVCIFRFDANVCFCWILAVCQGFVSMSEENGRSLDALKLTRGSVFPDRFSYKK